MEEIKLCGFIPGRGLSHEECVGSVKKEVDPKIEGNLNPACPHCGSHRQFKGEFNINCLNREAGCNFKIVNLWCADCGAKLDDTRKPIGKEDFKATPEIMERLMGISGPSLKF